MPRLLQRLVGLLPPKYLRHNQGPYKSLLGLQNLMHLRRDEIRISEQETIRHYWIVP